MVYFFVRGVSIIEVLLHCVALLIKSGRIRTISVLIPIYWTSFHVWYVTDSNIYCINSKDNKMYLNSHPIKNLLTFASVHLVKFCSFYSHLSLETLFPALKLTQICCINMNISFLENWQFLNHKLAPPLLLTYQAWKSNLTIWQNMKVTGIQKLQFSNSKVNGQKFRSTA